jgi:hypothetical protein
LTCGFTPRVPRLRRELDHGQAARPDREHDSQQPPGRILRANDLDAVIVTEGRWIRSSQRGVAGAPECHNPQQVEILGWTPLVALLAERQNEVAQSALRPWTTVNKPNAFEFMGGYELRRLSQGGPQGVPRPIAAVKQYNDLLPLRGG